MKFKALSTAALLCSFVTVAGAQAPSGVGVTAGGDRAPDGINRPAARQRGILYHGGPVQGTVSGQPVHLYYIFYGNWNGTDPGGPQIMSDFANSLGGSPYWNILTTYKEPKTGTTIKNALTLAGTVYDSGSQGASLSDSTLQKVVQKWISNGTFPADSNAIYHVLTSSEVNETSGFCSSYCGFHNHMSYSGKDIKYSFIGNPVHCTAQGGVSDCQGDSHNDSQSPNNDPGVDAMISVIAHESEEATSDPDLNAWYFANGEEDGDKCAYMYGTTHPVGNGSDYNVTMGSRNYLIQENWIGPGNPSGASGEKCALSY
jgi:Phosphate-induced protein 1 conserved region